MKRNNTLIEIILNLQPPKCKVSKTCSENRFRLTSVSRSIFSDKNLSLYSVMFSFSRTCSNVSASTSSTLVPLSNDVTCINNESGVTGSLKSCIAVMRKKCSYICRHHISPQQRTLTHGRRCSRCAHGDVTRLSVVLLIVEEIEEDERAETVADAGERPGKVRVPPQEKRSQSVHLRPHDVDDLLRTTQRVSFAMRSSVMLLAPGRRWDSSRRGCRGECCAGSTGTCWCCSAWSTRAVWKPWNAVFLTVPVK